MADSPSSLVALRDARERAIAALSDHFANDHLDLDEFDRRLDLAHRASSVAAVETLLADLPAASTAEPGEGRVATRVAMAEQVPDRRKLVNVLSGTQRRGRWVVPRQLRIVSVLGGAELDFREAAFGPGTTELQLTVVLGETAIVVPPGLAVEMEGSGFLGGFDQVDRTSAAVDPEAPLLRITGTVVLGGVRVETRLPGEDGRRRKLRGRGRRRLLLEPGSER